MSVLGLAKLTASYLFTDAGFSPAANHFTDQSGRGRHMPVVEGVPAFVDRDGKTALTGTQGSTFQAYVKNPVPIFGAVIAVFHANITGADGVRYLISYDSLDTAAGLHGTNVAQDGSEADEYDETNAGNFQRYIMTYIGQCRGGYINGNVATQNYTQNGWNVVVTGVSSIDGRSYTSVNGAPFTLSNLASVPRFSNPVEGLVGFMGNQQPPANGGHSDIAELHFVRDDLHLRQTDAVAAVVEALKVKYGIT